MTISIKRNSTTHVALQYLKMKKTWVTENDLYNLAPVKYKSKSKAKTSLDKLVSLTYAEYNGSSYRITEPGISALPILLTEQHRPSGLNDSIII